MIYILYCFIKINRSCVISHYFWKQHLFLKINLFTISMITNINNAKNKIYMVPFIECKLKKKDL